MVTQGRNMSRRVRLTAGLGGAARRSLCGPRPYRRKGIGRYLKVRFKCRSYRTVVRYGLTIARIQQLKPCLASLRRFVKDLGRRGKTKETETSCADEHLVARKRLDRMSDSTIHNHSVRKKECREGRVAVAR